RRRSRPAPGCRGRDHPRRRRAGRGGIQRGGRRGGGSHRAAARPANRRAIPSRIDPCDGLSGADARLPTSGSAAMSELTNVTLSINGRTYPLRLEPRRTLLDAIRDECGLTGTHMGCEHGVCGACTVLLDGDPVRACLIFAAQAEGSAIRTVEGLANGDELHPVQRAFIAHHGVQCGFCTPGFLMLATGILEREPDIDDDELLEVLSSNLCRCTGYQGIVAAVRAALAEARGAER